MYQSIDLFGTASRLASHAGARSAAIAGNIANADTPGYRAQAVEAFRETVDGLAPRRSRPGHLGAPTGAATPVGLRTSDRSGEAAPNGNTVSLETEMLETAAAKSDHNRALAVYRHAMGVIRTSLGGR